MHQPMRVAVVNETSAADRNGAILLALEGRGLQVLNCGMKKNGEEPQLTYLHTGFISALLLGTGCVDFVVGGCGTGQGFLNAVVQYPGVVCGHVATPLDAWLFSRINNGNCVSLMLNQGYGWGSDINLRLIFNELFTPERGSGFPESRKESQRESVRLLEEIGLASHRGLTEIVRSLPDAIAVPSLSYPGVREMVEKAPGTTDELARAIRARTSGQAS